MQPKCRCLLLPVNPNKILFVWIYECTKNEQWMHRSIEQQKAQFRFRLDMADRSVGRQDTQVDTQIH